MMQEGTECTSGHEAGLRGWAAYGATVCAGVGGNMVGWLSSHQSYFNPANGSTALGLISAITFPGCMVLLPLV